jgi:hypothetical protein
MAWYVYSPGYVAIDGFARSLARVMDHGFGNKTSAMQAIHF